MLAERRILIVISGGIAAYKTLELIRLLKEQGASVRCVMTDAAQQFIKPLSVSALSGEKVFTELFSLTDEAEIGHIRLARETDIVVVAPATANLIARMAAGMADDLATTILSATDKPVLVAPAMNVQMWQNPAVRRNVATLLGDGVAMVGPEAGDLACGEVGAGRMSDPQTIVEKIRVMLASDEKLSLSGRHVIVTSGPTRESIDPVRFISNHSSGKQGHATATACARLGADVTLVTGPVEIADPAGVNVVHVTTACEMLVACETALPADVAVCAAAVGDWRVKNAGVSKLKKNGGPPQFVLEENPDILAILAGKENMRPQLVVGFAAETDNVVARAEAKRKSKGCDWIVANDVSSGVFGEDRNRVHFVSESKTEDWPQMAKSMVAETLANRIAEYLSS